MGHYSSTYSNLPVDQNFLTRGLISNFLYSLFYILFSIGTTHTQPPQLGAIESEALNLLTPQVSVLHP